MTPIHRILSVQMLGVFALVGAAAAIVFSAYAGAGSRRSAAASTTELRVFILDAATGDPTPARVKLTTMSGRAAPLPEQAVAVMYGMWDHADGYGYQPDSSFYVDGSFALDVEPGQYLLSISKGNEYLAVTDTLYVDRPIEMEYRMTRWIDTAAMGWYSSDDHIHIRRSPREDPLLVTWTKAEDIRVGNMLRMGDFWEKYYSQYAFGQEGAYVDGGYLLVSGQEDPRTPELGHVIGLGASRFVRFDDRYYLYDLVFDGIRDAGGVGGYAHQAASFHGYRGLVLDGLRGKVDVLEIVQFCVEGGPLITEHYYDLLNLGIPVTATAGSDFPWCGMPHDGSATIPVHSQAQIGNARFYVQVDGALTYDSWREGVRAGRTFASSGPVLLMQVNGAPVGSRVDVAEGDVVHVQVTAYGHAAQVPLSRLEIVVHGDVSHSVTTADDGQSADRMTMEVEIPVSAGLWIAARAEADPMQVAHTTPVYVTVDGGGFQNDGALHHLLDRSESYLSDLEDLIDHRHEAADHQAWRHRDGLMDRIEETRGVIERMRRAHPH